MLSEGSARRMGAGRRGAAFAIVLVLASIVPATGVRAAAGDLALASTSDAGVKGNRESREPQLSDDGNIVAFRSQSKNLDPHDTDGKDDVYVKNLATGDITLASTRKDGVKSNKPSEQATISADGSVVAFQSKATNLDGRDVDDHWDVYVKNLVTGDLTLVSTATDGTKGNGDSDEPEISPDGTMVAFRTKSTNLTTADTDAIPDVYVKDLATGVTTLVSTDPSGVKGNAQSGRPSMSTDGSIIAFRSQATNLLAADRDSAFDIYVKTLASGTLALASSSATGANGNGSSTTPMLSADGDVVAFRTTATNLVAGDTDTTWDIDVKDLTTGAVTLASATATGTKSNGESVNPSLSADGTAVAFGTFATNLDVRDTDVYQDAYIKFLGSGALVLVSTAADGTKGNNQTFFPWASADGSYVAFRSAATNLVSQDHDTFGDVYVKQVA
jgi:hypothetical protein